MRSPILIHLPWFLLASLVTPCAASDLVPLGAPVSLLGDRPPGDELQRGEVVATAVSGGFAAVWHEDGDDFDHIAMIHLDSLGKNLGESVLFDWYPESLGFPNCPTVATLGPDRLVVAWGSHYPSSGPGITAFRRFTVDGAPIDPEIRVIRAPLGVVITGSCPIAAGNENGRFALGWRLRGEDSRAQAQGFKPSGERATPIFGLANSRAGREPLGVVIDRAGRTTLAAEGPPGDLSGERFSSAGVSLGAFRIGPGEGEVALAGVPSGGFLAAWSRGEVEGRQILMRRYGADGQPLGRSKVVGRTGAFGRPVVRVDHEGRAVLIWIDENLHLVGRLIEPDLSPAGRSVEFGSVGSSAGGWVRAGLALLGRRVLVVWFAPPAEVGKTPPLFGQLFDIRP